MECAVHLRTGDQEKVLGHFPGHLETFFGHPSLNPKGWSEEFSQLVSIAYIGDEFCSHRLPALSDLVAFHQFAEKKSLKVTLLTPVFTNAALKKHVPLFDFFKARDPETEIVVNDWGTLVFLREHYPHFRIAAGRIFNKGFKDPRLACPEKLSSLSAEAKELLTQSTFDGREIKQKMIELGVMRMEKDLLPYQHVRLDRVSRLKASIYFPFGYVTTGRVCAVASLTRPAPQKFIPLDYCPQPCSATRHELKGRDFAFPVMLSGNTVFYRYTGEMVASLLKAARNQEVRLVYQGLAL